MEETGYFQLKETFIGKVVSSPFWPILKNGKNLGTLFLVLSLLPGGLWLYQFLTHSFDHCYLLEGSFLIFLSLSLSWYYQALFYRTRLIQPKLKVNLFQSQLKGNLASFLDGESALLLKEIIKLYRTDLSAIPSVSLSILLFKPFPIIKFVFYRLGLSPKRFSAEWLENSKRQRKLLPSLGKILLAAAQEALKEKHSRLGIVDILMALGRYDASFVQVLIQHNLDANDFQHVLEWYERLYQKSKQHQKFWTLKNLLRKGSLAANWAAAYTLTIDRYATDWTRLARLENPDLSVLGHQKEIAQIEDILDKSGFNNVLLVGVPGSGRRDIILSLVSRSFWGMTPPSLKKKRVLELNIDRVINELPSREAVELTLEKCFQEAVLAGNVILVIDNLENYVNPDNPEINISATLGRYLHSSRFQVIALASYRGLHQSIEKQPSLLNLFNKVEVEPLTANQTLRLLELRVPQYEIHYNQFVLYQTLKKVVTYSARYFQDKPFPQKAFDLLDEVLVYAERSPAGDHIVWPKYVDAVVTEKTQIPVGQIVSSERETLVNLESLIHQSIINQNEAVSDIASALRRARTEVTAERNKPMGSFLFLGPTGVGKTETAKALARVYFGSEKRIIRMDMAEFQKPDDINRFIGNEERPGILTSQVRENPFSLVLFDEIEKAHPDILNLFLTVLDEGYLTDSWGRKVSFADTIIIATSNAGADLIWEDIRKDQKLDLIKQQLMTYLVNHNIFRPEFINRFDALVVFKPLTPDNLMAIAQLKLEKLAKTLRETKKIDFLITEDLKKKIVQLGYDPAFGARAMNRVIENKVENALARAILTGKIKKGDKVKMEAGTFQVVVVS